MTNDHSAVLYKLKPTTAKSRSNRKLTFSIWLPDRTVPQARSFKIPSCSRKTAEPVATAECEAGSQHHEVTGRDQQRAHIFARGILVRNYRTKGRCHKWAKVFLWRSSFLPEKDLQVWYIGVHNDFSTLALKIRGWIRFTGWSGRCFEKWIGAGAWCDWGGTGGIWGVQKMVSD